MACCWVATKCPIQAAPHYQDHGEGGDKFNPRRRCGVTPRDHGDPQQVACQATPNDGPELDRPPPEVPTHCGNDGDEVGGSSERPTSQDKDRSECQSNRQPTEPAGAPSPRAKGHLWPVAAPDHQPTATDPAFAPHVNGCPEPPLSESHWSSPYGPDQAKELRLVLCVVEGIVIPQRLRPQNGGHLA